MNDVKMFVSGIISKDGKKKACVRFESGAAFAEGYIPDCKIDSTAGFTKEEIEKLEKYLVENLEMLKGRAAGVDPIRSIMRE